MAEPTQSKKRQYESFKSKVSISNSSKFTPKPKVRYGVYVDRVYSGYWRNGVWNPHV